MAEPVASKTHDPPLSLIGVSSFRSFEKDPNVLAPLGRMNILVGRNNHGKSNTLALVEKIAELSQSRASMKVEGYDRNLSVPGSPTVAFSSSKYSIVEKLQDALEADDPEEEKDQDFPGVERLWDELFLAWPEAAKTESALLVWVELESMKIPEFFLGELVSRVDNVKDWKYLAELLNWTNSINYYEKDQLVERVVKGVLKLAPKLSCLKIPAIRAIGPPNPDFTDKHLNRNRGSMFDGKDLLDILFYIGSAPPEKPEWREDYRKIQRFFRDVIEDENATITVPSTRNQIVIELGGKELPIGRLGTGVEQLLIMATGSTLFHDNLVLIEEPETHLHPTLQRKLLDYLNTQTQNQYFITTHSPHLIDSPGVSIFHVWEEKNGTRVRFVDDNRKRFRVCHEIGCRASDLVQANAVIWVEGPSDRIFLKSWLSALSSELREGIEYSVMWYGGALLSHITVEDFESQNLSVDGLLSLLPLNRNSAIILDSDKGSSDDNLKPAVRRIESELKGEEYFEERFWVTNGREVENYIPERVLGDAIKEVHPDSERLLTGVEHQFESLTRLKTVSRKTFKLSSRSIDKVEVAKIIAGRAADPEDPFVWDWQLYGLGERIEGLIRFIRQANHLY